MLRNRTRLKIAGILAIAVLIGGITAGVLAEVTARDPPDEPPIAPVEGQTPGLDERCTISILNRTARVQPDGSWRIDNVPANLGRVRARVTCIIDGQTISGQSDFFDIVANQINGFNEHIPLGVVDPIPESIAVVATTTTLTAAGETTQLTVTATFPDASTEDITASVAGTNYTSSNPATATVSDDGVVTAITSGTVVISAINEGALGLLRIQVVLGGDSDGDGIGDDIELANGLDPNNPVDALEDPDLDGLTNFEELITLGTDHLNPDSDGDGLLDGNEVNVTGTDPLLFDTDGDDLGDGLEVGIGSDPLTFDTIIPAGALASLAVTPKSFVLNFNTILGEVSTQLTVIGTLIDGNTIDVTSTGRGTNYASSDLTICNFGADPGRIFAGIDGTCIITVTNTGVSDTATAIVRTFSPTALTSIAIPSTGYANNVDVVDDSVAYVAAGNDGLHIIDVSNLEGIGNLPAGRILGTQDTPGVAIDVKIVGNLAFVADGTSGLQIIDVTNPASTTIVGFLDTAGTARDVVVSGNRAYVADGASGIAIIDITDPASTTLVSTLGGLGTVRGIDVSANPDHAAVVIQSPSSVKIIDITDEANPVEVGSVAIPGAAKDLVVDGTHAFVASFTGGLQIVDFTMPNAPVIVGSLPGGVGGFVPRDVAIADQFLLAAEQLFPNAIPIVRITDPTDPIFVQVLNLSPLGDYAGTGIAVTQQFVYVTEQSFIVGPEFGTTGNTRLFIGKYRTVEDNLGVPPVVNITSPANGASVLEGSTLQFVDVTATDDVQVVVVDLLVDGQVFGTDQAEPFQFNDIPVPIHIVSLSLRATAIDLGSNIGTSPEVILTVLPDPPPTVTITSPADGATVIEGENITFSADATDNVAVTQVEFFIDGVSKGVDSTAPYSVAVPMPPLAADSPVDFSATATDNLDRTATDTNSVNVIPDPLTTVVGRAVDEAAIPVAGADVRTLGLVSVTGADGAFSIPSVPTILGDIVVRAEGVVGGVAAFGRSQPFAPVRGATTDVGDIELVVGGVQFSVTPGTTGVAGSGVEQVEQTVIDRTVDQRGMAIYEAVPVDTNVIALEGFDIGLLPLGKNDFPTNVIGYDRLPDASAIFTVGLRSQGVPGSAVEARRGTGLRHADIYRSPGDGTNELRVAGDLLGIQAFTASTVDAVVELADGSFLFSVDHSANGVAGSAVAAATILSRGMDIFRSTGDGTNVLFMAAADLGLDTTVCCGNVDGLHQNDDGSLLFSVSPPTVGLPGTAVASSTPSTLNSDVFSTPGDGTNALFLAQAALGIASGGVDALSRTAGGNLLFSVTPTTNGVAGSGVEEAGQTVVGQIVSQVPTSVFAKTGGDSNRLVIEGVDLGIDPGGGGFGFLATLAQEVGQPESGGGAQGAVTATGDGSGQGAGDGSGQGGGGGQSGGGGGQAAELDSASDGASGEAVGQAYVGEVEPADSDLDGLDVLGDGSFIFTVGPQTLGVPGSAVEARKNNGLLEADIFLSTGDGTNTLHITGNLLGIEAFTQTVVDAIALLPDGSVIFSVNPDAVGLSGSAVAAASAQTRGSNLYRSLADGTNELFRSAGELGISEAVVGSVDGLVWNPDGTIFFSVTPGTEGVPGSAVETVASTTPADLDSVVFLTRSDGTNELFISKAQMGITGSGVDALAFRPAPTEDQAGVLPLLDIVAPVAGDEFIEGDRMDIGLTVSDDVAVALLQIFVDGVGVATTSFPGASQVFNDILVPLGLGALNIEARATDLGGNTRTDTVQVTRIPDPLTTVIGLVVNATGTPVASSSVEIFGEFMATTTADGTFSVPGVPTIRGDIVVEASATVNGDVLVGRSAPVPAVRGSVTAVGQIVIEERIALVHSDSGRFAEAAKRVLVATGLFEADDITIIDQRSTQPSLAQLAEFGALLVWSNVAPVSPDAFGDTLADYVDQGGGLVLATYVYSQPSRIGGRIVDPAAGLSPFEVSAARLQTSGVLDLANSDTTHPILAGVNSAGYFVNFDYTNPPLTAGATLIASDTAGNRLIGVNANQNVVGILIFPGFLENQGTGDVGLIFANALLFVR